MKLRNVVMLLLLTLSARAQGEPLPPDTPAQAAAKVLAAEKAGDESALRALGARRAPDPWLVAEELCSEGGLEAASAFAKAAAGKGTERLADYVASFGAAGAAERRAALEASRADLTAGRFQAVADRVTPDGWEKTVTGIRLCGGRAHALDRLGRYDESSRAYGLLIGAAETLGWTARVIDGHDANAGVRLRSRDLAGAMEALRSAMDLATRIGDEGRIRRGHASLASAFERAGRLAEAAPHKEKELALVRRIGTEREVGLVLRDLGNYRSMMGALGPAQAHFEEALAIFRRLGWEPGISMVLNDSAINLENLGRFDDAIARYEEARPIFEKLGNRRGMANVIHNIGCIDRRLRRYRASLEKLQKAYEIFESMEDRSRMGNALGNIGITHGMLGNAAESRRCLLEVLDLRRAMRDRRGEGATHFYLCAVEQDLQSYAKAIRHGEAALAIFEELGAQGPRANLLCRMAEVHRTTTNLEKALEYGLQALEIYRGLGHPIGVATALDGLGLTLWRKGDLDGALDRYRAGMEIWTRLNNLPGQGREYRSIAAIHFDRDEFPQAIECYLKAIELSGGIDLTSRVGLGDAHACMGDMDAAYAVYENLLASLRDNPSPGPVAAAHSAIAEIELGRGRGDVALEHARKAIEIVDQLGVGLSEEHHARFRDQFSSILVRGTAVGLSTGNPEQAVWFLERAAAASFRASLGSRKALENVVLPPDLLRELSLTREEERQAGEDVRAANEAGRLKEIRAAMAGHAAAQKRLKDVVARVAREANAAARITQESPDDLATLKACLSEGEVLVLFGQTLDGLGAVVVEPKRSRCVDLGELRTIAEIADAGLASISRRGNVRAADENEASRGLGLDPAEKAEPMRVSELRRLLIEPLGLPKTARRIVIAPVSGLVYVPFSLLMPDRDVALVPSGTAYRMLLADRERRGKGVLALGDPSYGGSAAAAKRRGHSTARLSPLPGTRKEAKAVGTKILLGKDATETALRAALTERERWRAIHLACHGLVDAKRPMFSALAITPDGESDGFLNCLDLVTLKTPADLVVLSACETGTGRVLETEGVMGLTRAFMLAGSPRVICSLWNVDDEATCALMVKFYELLETHSTAAALRGAQQFVASQEKWKHPYYWAAWQLWGLGD